MKIFTAAQIRTCDVFSIEEQQISSWQLMERAANRCFEWIINRFDTNTPFLLICGMGNNGGDGLALTRILLQEGYSAKATVVNYGSQFSPDTSENFKLLHQLAPDNIQMLEEGMFVTELPEDIVLIDALFGTGINKALSGWLFDFVQVINELPNYKIAIDMPSGLPADALPLADAAILKANFTLSFQYYKRSFLHVESAQYVGELHLLDIGLSQKYAKATHTQYHTIDAVLAKSIYKPRNNFAHKGTMGHALLIGGSYGKIGAIQLSGHAALRSGAGLVSVSAPECACQSLQTALPEAMFLPSGKNWVSAIEQSNTYQAIGIGPGMGTHEETAKAVLQFITKVQQSLVIDADALNVLSQDEDNLLQLQANTILTPHPKEFERLFGKTNNSMLQVELGRARAMKYNIIIVLKGRHTAVLLPNGECWYNTTGNSGMATGGSGDVLTGIITGLLAQGYSPSNAAILAVYLHGLAGDIATATLSREAMLAGDIIHNLGKAYQSVAS